MKKKPFFIFTFSLLVHFSFGQWTTSGNNIYNSNSGNVGIGVTGPAEKLHIGGNLKFGHTDGGAGLNFIEWYTSNYGSGFGHKIYTADPGGSTALRFAARHNNASWSDMMTLTSNGYIGIATTSPEFSLDVNAIARFRAGSSTNANVILQGGISGGSGYQAFWLTGANGILKIGGNGTSEPSEGVINIDYQGHVSIGTTSNNGYKFAVNGSAIFTEAKVKLYANWPDYVFHENYNLMPLNKVEEFIYRYNHLPGIPSAKEVKENGGIELGNMIEKLLKKIEELTLYIIELKHENIEIKERLRDYKK
jgi:hypothetical protein